MTSPSDFTTSATFPRISLEQTKEEFPKDLKLVQVQFIHRHGQRSSLSYRLPQFYPSGHDWCARMNEFSKLFNQSNYLAFYRQIAPDPNMVKELSNKSSLCYLGQLSDLGSATMTEIGKNLRHLYLDHLDLFNQEDFSRHLYLRSTNYPRTIESLQSLVQGFLPEAKGSLEIDVREEYFENMYATNHCARFKRLFQEYRENIFLRSPEVAQIRSKLADLFGQVNYYGHPPSTFGLYDTLISQNVHGGVLPPSVGLDDLQALERIAHLEWFDIYRRDPAALRLSIGRFLGELLDNCHKAISSAAKPMLIYSGHDSTIGPLGTGLGLPAHLYPVFAANIAIEAFKSPSVAGFVRVRYNGLSQTLSHCASSPSHHFPGHPDICTIEAFHEAVSRNIPKDFLNECKDS